MYFLDIVLQQAETAKKLFFLVGRVRKTHT